MAIPSSGQSLSFSALRTEFVGGSSAISLGDLYRGGTNIKKKAGDNQAVNLAASVATSGAIDVSDYYDQAKGFTFTYSTTGLSGTSGTDQDVSTLFGDDYDLDYPKNVVIPSAITLGTNNTSEFALEVDSGGAGTITITNNGTIMGAGGAGGSAGSAGSGGAGGDGGDGSAGGDAIKVETDCTIINNGSILAGGGGGAGGAGGGLGGNLEQQQQTTVQQGPTIITTPSNNTRWTYIGNPYYSLFIGFGPLGGSVHGAAPPGGNNVTGNTGAYVGPGGASQTSYTKGIYTYTRGPAYALNVPNLPENPQFYYNYYRISVSYPQQSQNQVSGHSGGAGAAGGLGRGFNNQPGGDSGASGASGSTGDAGNGGNGGNGGDGGGFGQAGSAGQAGQAGTDSTTSGSAGGSAGSVGAAGLAIEKDSPISLTFTNNGTVSGTVQS